MRKHLFLIYFTLLMLATYRGYSEEFIVVSFLILRISTGKIYIRKINIKNSTMAVFIAYCFIVTILNIATGNTEASSVLFLLILLVILPISIKDIVAVSTQENIIADLLILAVVSACYGLVESRMGYNPIYQIVNISARNWIIAMNNTYSIYQPSSFYLHYTYYASILTIGIAICLIKPISNKILNALTFILFSEQLLITQSRICWIIYLILLITYFWIKGYFKKTYITQNKLIGFCIVLIILALIITTTDIPNKIISTVQARFGVLIKYGLEDGSLGQRIGTLMNWPKYLVSNPIQGIVGSGYRSIQNAFLNEYSYFKGYVTADNQYLTILVETGIIGFVIFIVALIKFIKQSNNRNTEIGRLMILCTVAYLLECFTYDITTYFVFALVLTLAFMSKESIDRS